jgi:SAM-dependent methyltransferase
LTLPGRPRTLSALVRDPRPLPLEFVRDLEALEAAYLRESDPILQSGFHGGAARWRAEREPILDAVDRDGDLLDVGCANGYLLECLCAWASERGLRLVPYGVDQGARLVELARRRFPGMESHFCVANAWGFEPPRRFRYVYALYDCVPRDFLAAWVRQLLASAAAPGGRLIVGAYGSRSRGLAPFDVPGFLRAQGLRPAGVAWGGEPLLTVFAWLDAPAARAA